MAKIKSIKFYNFIDINGSQYTATNARFYDINGELILIDFSNPMQTPTSTYCESSEYIVTSYSGGGFDAGNYPQHSFHVGNKNLNVNIPHIGYAWVPSTMHATSNDFLKIEFKFPQYLSKIEILHSYNSAAAIDTMDYDIEFDNKTVKTYHFKSNGTFSPLDGSITGNFSWDQDVMDSLFSELKFDKSKQIYDSNVGLIETLDVNNFRNISVDKFKSLKVLYKKPLSTILNCIVSFDKKQTWKTFDGSNWNVVSDASESNIIINCMDVGVLNTLNKNQLISGGFTGDLDFKIVMKTNDVNKTPSITKIYVEYK